MAILLIVVFLAKVTIVCLVKGVTIGRAKVQYLAYYCTIPEQMDLGHQTNGLLVDRFILTTVPIVTFMPCPPMGIW